LHLVILLQHHAKNSINGCGAQSTLHVTQGDILVPLGSFPLTHQPWLGLRPASPISAVSPSLPPSLSLHGTFTWRWTRILFILCISLWFGL